MPLVLEGEVKPVILGYELEVSVPDKHSSRVSEFREKVRNVMSKWDSSIYGNGHEFILRNPASFEYIKKDEETKLLFEYASKFFKSGNSYNCGLHVHICQSTFGETDEERMLAFAKMVGITQKYWEFFFPLTRRHETNLNRWAKLHPIPDNLIQDYANNLDEIAERLRNARWSKGYTISHRDRTFEFRMFSGTTSYRYFLGNLELVHALSRLAQVEAETLRDHDVRLLAGMLAMGDYPFLAKQAKSSLKKLVKN